MVQGLPFGFQVGALPIFLREQGVGLAAIGYSTALAAPWALKIFWALLVERFGGLALDDGLSHQSPCVWVFWSRRACRYPTN